MKLAISNIAWSKEVDDKIFSLMEKYWFTGLEIAPVRTFPSLFDTEKHEIESFIKKINNYGVSAVAMQSLLYWRNDLKLFWDTSNELYEYLTKIMDFWADLWIKSFIFWSPKNRIYEWISKDEAINQWIDFFNKVWDYAKNKNVFLCIEPNPEIYWWNFMCSTEETLKFVKLINNPWIKLHLDLWTVIENKEPIDLISKCIPYISHFHISEPFLEPIQEREINKEIRDVLWWFDWFCSIEMKWTSIENIEKSLSYVSKIYG